MNSLKIFTLLILSFCLHTTALAQTGRYELLDQDEAIRVFSAPVGSQVRVMRNGKADVIVKKTIIIAERPVNLIFEDLALVRQLPGFMTQDIRFNFGSEYLTADAQAYLNLLGARIVSSYQSNPNLTLLIAGYTDAVGSAAYNLNLSARRAEAVKLFLVEQFGLPSCLFNTVSFGENWDGLLVKTKQANAMNRRVEIRSTDILTNSATGQPMFSCQAQYGSAATLNPSTSMAQNTTGSSYCNASRVASTLTVTFKGFNESEFITHLSKMWSGLTSYADHTLVEAQPHIRRFRLDLLQGNCEILDDIADHLNRNGYRIDDQIVLSMNGNAITIEKL